MEKSLKKVLLFIADGPTDEDALSPIFKKIFQSAQVRFHIVHGDITSDLSAANENAVNAVNEHVKWEMERYGFRRSDILKVIHLIDTDGAFIPDDQVEEGAVPKLCYEENRIVTSYLKKTIERNERKKQMLRRLSSVKKIGGSSYEVYYFSRNREHVLHHDDSELTNEQKVNRADGFADTYGNDPGKFIQFLSESDFTVQGDYGETWQFIFEGTNSLHRHCNLHLMFR